MNNFNKVFGAVKNVCKSKNVSATSFDAVSKEVNMRYERLEFYINCLSEVGLVEYRRADQMVALTEAGKNRAAVFLD